jgi:NAD(P)-dependent dehydrogenase (short-subunit alcohol dehydrogenase family)
MGSLDGKIAIITGGGQGIGRGTALEMARAGASLVLSGRTLEKLNIVVAEIEALGARAVAVRADVNAADDLADVVQAALAAFGGIDILVNNAQESPLGRLLDVTDEAFLRGFNSGPLATFRMMKLCYPHLKARGGGSIVNMCTSAAVRWDMSGYGAYGAVKNAIRVLSRAAACEWGQDNIRVNTVAPHALSPGLQGWMAAWPEEAAAFVKTIPLGRVGDCESDIGAAIVQLVGPGMVYLSGATIPLDGGQANFD